MATMLTVHEETPSGKPTGRFEIELLTERVTIRELIRSRVYQKVKDRNSRAIQDSRKERSPGGLTVENTPEGLRPASASVDKENGSIDWHAKFERALDAFQQRRFLVLVDDQQIGGLDEEIVVVPETVVTFVRLTPLVGG